MRFDVDTAMSAYARSRQIAERKLFDYATERALLGGLLADDTTDGISAVSLCVGSAEPGADHGIEVEDFADYRHRAVMQAFRNLEHRGARVQPVDMVELADEIARIVVDADSKGCGLAFLVVDLVLAQPRVSADWIACARKRLRDLANHRRLA